MRYLPGMPQTIANESINSLSLTKMMVNQPDIIPTIFTLFSDDISPLTSLLSYKGLKTKNLFEGLVNNQYKVLKSNVVEYAIKSSRRRKMRLMASTEANGAAYKTDAYPTQPGKNLTPFYIYTDSNWAGAREVLELADNQTYIYVYNDEPPVEVDGLFRYECELVGNDKDMFVDPALLQPNAECTPTWTLYEQDFSETGVEKYTGDAWGRAYMSLQRLKYSISGTAKAMGASKYWTEHKGFVSYLDYAENEMLRRAAEYHEAQIVFGKGTVAVDGQVMLKTKSGREVMAGDGLLNANEGAYEYPHNGNYTLKYIEKIMQDIDIRAGKDGYKEVVVLGGMQWKSQFSALMRKHNILTQNQNIVGDGASKGVINTYSFYELDNVRIIPKTFRYFDDETRPSFTLSDGTKSSSHQAIFIPIGMNEEGKNNVELVTLRPMKMGVVEGINVGGKMATSVDGEHHHCLFQTGIISRAKISYSFRPLPANTNLTYYNPVPES